MDLGGVGVAVDVIVGLLAFILCLIAVFVVAVCWNKYRHTGGLDLPHDEPHEKKMLPLAD